MHAIPAIDEVQTSYKVTDDKSNQIIEKIFCPTCGAVVQNYHRYCWNCGRKLYIPKVKEEKDSCEIYSSGKQNIQQLCTYGRNAKIIEPK